MDAIRIHRRYYQLFAFHRIAAEEKHFLVGEYACVKLNVNITRFLSTRIHVLKITACAKGKLADILGSRETVGQQSTARKNENIKYISNDLTITHSFIVGISHFRFLLVCFLVEWNSLKEQLQLYAYVLISFFPFQ